MSFDCEFISHLCIMTTTKNMQHKLKSPMKTISTSPYIESKNQLIRIESLPGHKHLNYVHLQINGEEKIVKLIGGVQAIKTLQKKTEDFRTDWRDFIVVIKHTLNGPYAKVHEYPVVYEKVIVCCSRCSGTGYLPQYNHIQAGVCFKCRDSDPKKELLAVRSHETHCS